MGSGAELYDSDFFAWTQQQAAALRDVAKQRPNFQLDWDNLAEEVECLGASLWRELHSRIGVIIQHLLKLGHSPAAEPRAGWMDSIDWERSEIELLLRQNPSLDPEVAEAIAEEIPRAVRTTIRALERYGETEAAAAIRASSPDYTSEQVLGDWWPESSGVA